MYTRSRRRPQLRAKHPLGLAKWRDSPDPEKLPQAADPRPCSHEPPGPAHRNALGSSRETRLRIAQGATASDRKGSSQPAVQSPPSTSPPAKVPLLLTLRERLPIQPPAKLRPVLPKSLDRGAARWSGFPAELNRSSLGVGRAPRESLTTYWKREIRLMRAEKAGSKQGSGGRT